MRDGAVIILQSGKGLYWLAQRLKAAAFNGMWGFPGGAIEEGEEPVATAARELAEETGISVPPSSLRFITESLHRALETNRAFRVHWFFLKTSNPPQQLEDKSGPWKEVSMSEMSELDLTPGTFTLTERVNRNSWE